MGNIRSHNVSEMSTPDTWKDTTPTIIGNMDGEENY